ncbi:LytR family transcriptional regulator [Epidermidibacterium keratini]|uniref:LytR family transcriptional regulator n=1 Tax=Epidermidibacterium keratini TaxID=1891644 RepID=A0A7L4YQY9_9ACTN|nr:LCP family protein [Epidermidibacterium keratini]QHC01540.1 LytR family transcriptional regulator [Epidermidibacterium keratini]
MSDEDLPELPAHLDPRQPPRQGPLRRRGAGHQKKPAARPAPGPSNETPSEQTRSIEAVVAATTSQPQQQHAATDPEQRRELDPAEDSAVRRITTGSTAQPVTRRQRRRHEHPVQTAMLRASRAVSALLALVLLVGSGLTYAYFNRLTAQAGTGTSLEDVEGNSAGEGYSGEAMDILMIGTDGRAGTDIPEEDAGGGLQNTDTMMLIHVPADGSRASIVSFPRDTYVQLPNGENSKLNAAYAFGYNDAPEGSTEQQRKDAGRNNLIQTINILSGVQIDHFVEVTLAGFKDLTKAVGGVEVNLCAPVDDSYSGANFPAGKQHLDENQALAFVRQRHGLPNGDLDRIKRQQYFMGAMIREVLDQGMLDLLNLDKLNQLVDALANTISYDAGLNPLQLAEQLRNIAAGDVEFRTIPLAEPPEDRIPGIGDVLMPADDAQMKAFFNGLSGPEPTADEPSSESSSTTSSAPAIDPASITVDVYDGTQTPGLADQLATTLTTAGFVIDNRAPALTSDYQATEVHYPAGMEAQATAVAAALPGASVLPDNTAPAGKILVIVGSTYGSPDATATPTADPGEPDSTAANTDCIN